MNCREIRNRTSEYLDRQLDEAERIVFAGHLADCSECWAHVEETRDVIGVLRGLELAPPPPDLLVGTLRALDRTTEARLAIVAAPPRRRLKPKGDPNLGALLRRLFYDYEFKVIAYSVGLIVSFCLFAGTLASFRPMVSIREFLPRESEPIWIQPTEGSGNGEFATITYDMPQLRPDGSFPRFAANTRSIDPDGLYVLAEVTPDGRATIVEVLSEGATPRTIDRLAVALDRPNFVTHPTRPGQPASSLVVLFVDRVNVIG